MVTVVPSPGEVDRYILGTYVHIPTYNRNDHKQHKVVDTGHTAVIDEINNMTVSAQNIVIVWQKYRYVLIQSFE